MSDPSRTRPLRFVFGTIGLVAACTMLLPNVSGYGTIWSQRLQEGAWTLVARFNSANYANLHRDWVEATTIGLSVLAFAIPAGLFWSVLGGLWPRFFRVVQMAWTIVYLAALFFLFPGPIPS